MSSSTGAVPSQLQLNWASSLDALLADLPDGWLKTQAQELRADADWPPEALPATIRCSGREFGAQWGEYELEAIGPHWAGRSATAPPRASDVARLPLRAPARERAGRGRATSVAAAQRLPCGGRRRGVALATAQWHARKHRGAGSPRRAGTMPTKHSRLPAVVSSYSSSYHLRRRWAAMPATTSPHGASWSKGLSACNGWVSPGTSSRGAIPTTRRRCGPGSRSINTAGPEGRPARPQKIGM